MFNPDLVEYESTDRDDWDDRGHFTYSVGEYPLLGIVHEALVNAYECCIEHAPDADFATVAGILTTHMIEAEASEKVRHHPVDVDDIETLCVLIRDCTDETEALTEIRAWLEDMFPERETDEGYDPLDD
jgi:hypothetical protein